MALSQERQAGVSEFEITPAMERAGVECLLDRIGERVPPNWPVAGVIAADLWRAMECARLSGRQGSPGE